MKLKLKNLFLAATAITLLFSSSAFACPGSETCKGDSKSPWKYWLGGGYTQLEHGNANEGGQVYELRGSYDFNDRITGEVGLGGSPFLEGNDFNAPSDREATYNGRNSPGENFFVRTDLGMLYHLNTEEGKKWDPFVSVLAGIDAFGKRREANSASAFGGPGVGTSYWFNKDFAVRADYNFLVAENSHADLNHQAMIFAFYRFGSGAETSGDKNANDAADNGLGADTSSGLKPVYFDYDKAIVKPDAQKTLQENAAWMKSNGSKKVSVEGHCDERGTNEYNMALGARRAKSAYDYLRNLGVDKDQMSTNSFGEEFPADPGHNEEAWRKNRRVESVIQK